MVPVIVLPRLAKLNRKKLVYFSGLLMMSQLAGMLYVVRDFAIGECGEDYNLYGCTVRMITLRN